MSPLLANIALHGLEEAAANVYPKKTGKPVLIRYADDFVVLHPEKAVLDQAAEAIETWLQGMGLFLNQKKTRVTHTLTPYEGNVGFEFLGFSVSQLPKTDKRSGKDTHGRPLGFKTFIRPSKEVIKRHMAATKDQLRRRRGVSQEAVIRDLSRVIRGWANYYRTVESSRTFKECDHILHFQLFRWGQWRHPHKGNQWVEQRYWHRIGTRKIFAVSKENQIRLHRDTHIIRPYVKVRGNASPYDGDLLYWSKRLKHHPLIGTTQGKLLQRQNGKCFWCGLTFKDGDAMEIDVRRFGGREGAHPMV